jgi:hypothetical protein
MFGKVGQIIARGEPRWLVRVYLGRDRETRKRTYHNRTIYTSLRHAQAYLTKRLHERDLSRGVEGLQVTVDEFLDHWLKTAVKPRARGKTYGDYAAMLRRYIRPAIGARMMARWQLLLSDPTQGVELPREQCREMYVLTTEQDDSHPHELRSPNQTTQLLQPYCAWLSAPSAEVSRKEGQ